MMHEVTLTDPEIAALLALIRALPDESVILPLTSPPDLHLSANVSHTSRYFLTTHEGYHGTAS